MSVKPPSPIPFPESTFPGLNPQEACGRLINCYWEQLGEGTQKGAPAPGIRRRCPGLSFFARTAQTGYRGGLIVNNLSYEAWKNYVATIDDTGVVSAIGTGDLPGTQKISIARNQASPTPDVVAVDIDNGAYVIESAAVTSASNHATLSGSSFVIGDVIEFIIINPFLDNFPVSLSYTVVSADTPTSVALAITNLINANTILAAANITATTSAGVIRVSQQGSIGNETSLSYAVTGTGNEIFTFNPTSTSLVGGGGTVGAFTGSPTSYNGQGNLPQPNSVSFQDGYFFFTVANGFVLATALNSLSMNALTQIVIQSKSDVVLLRGIPFGGMMLFFTTGSCEIWEDVANPAPDFPYGRLVVLEFGLVQANAIAGWDTGFSNLLWVAQDFGIYWMPAGSLSPIKASPPDLDKLIETEVRNGNNLEAGCYVFGGKKFWTLSSPNWTWEFNIATRKWNERWSLNAGQYGRWRGVGGHPAFGKWLMGDEQSGNLLWPDVANYTENGAPQLMRVESGPVKNFPADTGIARADFDFDMGIGISSRVLVMNISGAAANPSGLIRLLVDNTSEALTNDRVNVADVVGTTEANSSWLITIVDATHIDLQGSSFVNAYISGGTATDVTTQANVQAPQVAISTSLDGGQRWGSPLLRQLGPQAKQLRYRASVKHMGLSGPMGNRWRVDITDAVYVGLMGGYQASDARAVGT